MRSARWAVFLSGRGSTAQSAFDMLPHLDIALVVSDQPQALGLKRARRMGIAQWVAPMKAPPAKGVDWNLLNQELTQRRITHIFLLGFMRIVPEFFVQTWAGRIFNIHPSLLPAFPGLEAMEKSFASGEDMGVSIHHVIAEMDAGALLRQRRVFKKTEPRDSWESTALQMAACEQRMIRDFILGWRGAHV